MVWKLLTDEGPEFRGMVEFFEVTEFVDDDVIGQVGREQGELVAEI